MIKAFIDLSIYFSGGKLKPLKKPKKANNDFEDDVSKICSLRVIQVIDFFFWN